MRSPHRHSIGINRRELLQVGYSGLLGLTLPAILGRQAAASSRHHGGNRRQPKSVLLIFLTGAPSHLDIFDLKPEAPAARRGPR